MTKQEQDRLNAAMADYMGEGQSPDRWDELKAAAQPLLEKENGLRVGIMHGVTWMEAIQLPDTPHIVQKGEKPIKLEEGYVVLKHKPDIISIHTAIKEKPEYESVAVRDYINSLRVDCDD